MGNENFKLLVERYKGLRTICNCGEAYRTPKPGFADCAGGCSSNILTARDEIASRVVAEFDIKPVPLSATTNLDGYSYVTLSEFQVVRMEGGEYYLSKESGNYYHKTTFDLDFDLRVKDITCGEWGHPIRNDAMAIDEWFSRCLEVRLDNLAFVIAPGTLQKVKGKAMDSVLIKAFVKSSTAASLSAANLTSATFGIRCNGVTRNIEVAAQRVVSVIKVNNIVTWDLLGYSVDGRHVTISDSLRGPV